MRWLDWLFPEPSPRLPLCERVGFHSYQWHWGWGCYVCMRCGAKVTRDSR